MSTDVLGYLYASAVGAGGIVGYAKAGSIPSLGAGLAFGVILGVGAYLNSQPTPKPLLQLSTSMVLAGVMGFRWYNTGKLMPAGVVCILSTAALIRNVATYNQYLKAPSAFSHKE